MPSITLDDGQALDLPKVRLGRAGRGPAPRLLAIHIPATILLAMAGPLASALQLDLERLLYPACVVVTAMFLWMLGSWYWLRRKLFEPYPLFIFSAGLFNGGQAFLETFGLNSNGILSGRVSPDILTPALYLVAISAGCVHTGALVASGRPSGRAPDSAGTERQQATRMAGWCLLVVALAPTFILLRSSLSLVMDHGYMSLFRNLSTSALSAALALSAFLVPGIIFLLAGSARKPGIQIFCLTLTALYTGTYLFLGTRGSAAMVCVAVVWVFDRSIRCIPRVLIAGLALIAMLIFPLVRETRLTGGRYRLSLGEQLETLGNLESPVVSSISEMGHSLVTVTHTLKLVPETRPYDYGFSYFYALAAIVPNLGWAVHPSIQHGLLSEWLIKTVDPFIAASGGGLGFSFIAEAYLNFGWLGGPIWLGLVGFMLAWLFGKADGADPARHAFAASFLSFFLVFARGESAIVARGLVWYAIVPFILASLLTTRRRKTALWGRPPACGGLSARLGVSQRRTSATDHEDCSSTRSHEAVKAEGIRSSPRSGGLRARRRPGACPTIDSQSTGSRTCTSGAGN